MHVLSYMVLFLQMDFDGFKHGIEVGGQRYIHRVLSTGCSASPDIPDTGSVGGQSPHSLHSCNLHLWPGFSFAFLQIVHAALGLVKSNPVLTAFQIFSRVLVTWGIAYSVPEVGFLLNECMHGLLMHMHVHFTLYILAKPRVFSTGHWQTRHGHVVGSMVHHWDY